MAPAADPSFLKTIRNRVKRSPRLYRFALHVLSPILIVGRSARDLVRRVPPDGTILHLGSGNNRLPGTSPIRAGARDSAAGPPAPRAVNVDLFAFPEVDVVADLVRLPFPDGSAQGVVSEVVLEHVPDPEAVVAEMERVLAPGGSIYVVVPFLQPFHAAPADYQRYTLAGLRALMGRFEEVEAGVRGGPTSALLWIAAEWLALVLSLGIRPVRRVLSPLLQIALAPLKLLDLVVNLHPDAADLASVCYFIGRKPG